MEFKTKKEIVYRLERSTVCTYEMDDTPPFEVDEEAIRGAIEIAQLCNLNLVSELHVMRKQYDRTRMLGAKVKETARRHAQAVATRVPGSLPALGAIRSVAWWGVPASAASVCRQPIPSLSSSSPLSPLDAGGSPTICATASPLARDRTVPPYTPVRACPVSREEVDIGTRVLPCPGGGGAPGAATPSAPTVSVEF